MILFNFLLNTPRNCSRLFSGTLYVVSKTNLKVQVFHFILKSILAQFSLQSNYEGIPNRNDAKKY